VLFDSESVSEDNRPNIHDALFLTHPSGRRCLLEVSEKMNARQKPQRTFLAVTLLTVLAVTTVFLVYAALLATYTGGNVTISLSGGSIQYSLPPKDPGSWGATLAQSNGSEWYARVSMTNPPTQTVTVKWTLQKQVSGSWSNPPTNTTQFTSNSFDLTPSSTEIYAFQSGSNTITNNYNWGQHTTTDGTYRVVAEINTA